MLIHAVARVGGGYMEGARALGRTRAGRWEGEGGSGRPVSSSELTLRASRLSCFQALTAAEVEELIKMADPNGDGKVSLEEFKDMECWKIPEYTMRPRSSPPRQSEDGSAASAS